MLSGALGHALVYETTLYKDKDSSTLLALASWDDVLLYELDCDGVLERPARLLILNFIRFQTEPRDSNYM
jgi:hypothetical protein